MGIGFTALVSETLLAFPVLHSRPRKQRISDVSAHVIGGIASLVLILAGFSAIYVNKENKGKDHFTSWHGWLGAIASTGIILQGIAGMMLNVKSLLPKFLLTKRNLLMKMHAFAGIVFMLMGFTVLSLGAYTKWLSAIFASIPYVGILAQLTIVSLPASFILAILSRLLKSGLPLVRYTSD
jgi:cytochrome b-561 domain-containing protein 2